jgi:hypothetical protein
MWAWDSLGSEVLISVFNGSSVQALQADGIVSRFAVGSSLLEATGFGDAPGRNLRELCGWLDGILHSN